MQRMARAARLVVVGTPPKLLHSRLGECASVDQPQLSHLPHGRMAEKAAEFQGEAHTTGIQSQVLLVVDFD